MLLLLTLTLRGAITISPTVVKPPIIDTEGDFFTGRDILSYRSDQNIDGRQRDDDDVLAIIKVFLRVQNY